MRPLLPFPFPINIGTDICQIHRIYRIVSSPQAARFVDRILTKDEQAWNVPRLRAVVQQDVPKTDAVKGDSEASQDGPGRRRKRDPEMWAAAAFLAGRFAAKEAAIKAHSHRRLTFHDVVIEPRADPGGGRLLGSGPKIARIRGEEKTGGGGEGAGESDSSAMISISHDGDYATASCLAYDPHVVDSSKQNEHKT